ncbi:MAG: hypothetical protein RID81_06980 [Sandaracinaceae bacterium]
MTAGRAEQARKLRETVSLAFHGVIEANAEEDLRSKAAAEKAKAARNSLSARAGDLATAEHALIASNVAASQSGQAAVRAYFARLAFKDALDALEAFAAGGES